MDAFYASVEQRDNPELKGKAVVVGGPPEGRGVVASASYEARKYGVRSAMSSRMAKRLCPHAIFIYPRHHVYKEVSTKIREIFGRYTDLIEPLSLDEAYLDVTEDKLQIGSAIEIAQQIRQAIKTELQLTASAGVSINKFVAKIASDLHKPDGLTFIGPSKVQGFMEKLPVEKFHGVGKVTAEKMKKMDIHTGMDLKQLSEKDLVRYFGKVGHFYFKIVRGIDNREVRPDRETKSVSAEDTFAEDESDVDVLLEEIEELAAIVVKRLSNHKLKGRTITIKIKYSDFKQITRSSTLAYRTDDLKIITDVAKQLLLDTDREGKLVRLLGVGISNFEEQNATKENENDSGQLDLF